METEKELYQKIYNIDKKILNSHLIIYDANDYYCKIYQHYKWKSMFNSEIFNDGFKEFFASNEEQLINKIKKFFKEEKE